MSVALLSLVKRCTIGRLADLTFRLTQLQEQKTNNLYRTSDEEMRFSAAKREVNNYYRDLYENDPDYTEYGAFDEIPGYEEAIDMLDTQHQMFLRELTAQEQEITAELNTVQTEKAELEAYKDSVGTVRNECISREFKFGSN